MSVRPRNYDAAAWADLRRRALTKAVQCNEMVLARLRTWLDELPAPQSGSGPPEAASISPSSPSDHGSNGAGYQDRRTPDLALVGTTPETVLQEPAPVSVKPEHSTLSDSPWVPDSVAEAFPEPRPQAATSHAAATEPRGSTSVAHPKARFGAAIRAAGVPDPQAKPTMDGTRFDLGAHDRCRRRRGAAPPRFEFRV